MVAEIELGARSQEHGVYLLSPPTLTVPLCKSLQVSVLPSPPSAKQETLASVISDAEGKGTDFRVSREKYTAGRTLHVHTHYMGSVAKPENAG